MHWPLGVGSTPQYWKFNSRPFQYIKPIHTNSNCFKILHVSKYDSKSICAFISVKTLWELYWFHPLSSGKIWVFCASACLHSSSKTWQVTNCLLLPRELHFISLVEYPTGFLLFILTHLVFQEGNHWKNTLELNKYFFLLKISSLTSPTQRQIPPGMIKNWGTLVLSGKVAQAMKFDDFCNISNSLGRPRTLLYF